MGLERRMSCLTVRMESLSCVVVRRVSYVFDGRGYIMERMIPDTTGMPLSVRISQISGFVGVDFEISAS